LFVLLDRDRRFGEERFEKEGTAVGRPRQETINARLGSQKIIERDPPKRTNQRRTQTEKATPRWSKSEGRKSAKDDDDGPIITRASFMSSLDNFIERFQ